jgi:NlpC/P60 family
MLALQVSRTHPALAAPRASEAMPTRAAAWPAGVGVVEPDGSLFLPGASFPPWSNLVAPVVGWAPRPGGGDWEVATDGGVFTRNAPFFGSLGDIRLAQPIVGMAATQDGRGYWLVAADGGIFTFGDARFYGSVAGRASAPAVSVTAAPTGYVATLADGSVWTFGAGLRAADVLTLPLPAGERLNYLQERIAATVVQVALAQVGTPYVFGGAGPGGFDCSGLTQYAYAAAGIQLPRTAAEQFAATPEVPLTDARPGDLLFFYPGITHVGIYLGDGLMVDAPHPGAFVRVEQFEPWFGPVMGVGRPG